LRTRKYQLAINGIDVCAPTFSAVHGITSNLVRRACELDLALQSSVQDIVSRELAEAQKLNCSLDRMHAISFVIEHAKQSGAELMPMGDDLVRAESFFATNGDCDELCIQRLQESGIT
jgi:hypothetical protein